MGQLADGCFQAGIASFVFFSPERRTSALEVALAFAVILLPYSVIGPFAGVLLDRWSRQRVLVAANLLRGLGCLGVALLVVAGRADGVFLGAALAVIGLNRFVLSGLSAALPQVVDPGELVPANAVATTAGTLATVSGVGLGVGLRLFAGAEDSGVAVVIAAAAVGYVVAATLAGLLLDRHQLGPDLDEVSEAVRAALGSVVRGFVEGAQHLWQRVPVRAAIGAQGGYRFGWGLVTVGAILLFRQTYNPSTDPDAGLRDLGLAFLLGGIGVFLGAVMAAPLAGRFGADRVVAGALMVAAVAELVLGSAFTRETLLASALVISGAGQALKVCVDSIVQAGIEDAYRGRVFSVYDLVFNAVFVAAGVLASLVLPPGGRSLLVVWLSAAVWAGVAGAYARTARQA